MDTNTISPGTKVINGQPLTEEECFVEHERLIWHCVKNFRWVFRNSVIDQDDLYSEGCIGLLKSYRRFDESYGVKFSTYAVPMIMGQIKRYIRDFFHPVKYPRHMRNFNEDSPYKKSVMSFSMTIFHSSEGDDITLENRLYDEDDYTEIYFKERLKEMPERTQKIIQMKLSGMTQEEIGEHFGISQVHVHRLINKEVAI